MSAESVWWIATGRLDRDGKRVMGPFATIDGAFQAREYLERLEGHNNYWIDRGPAEASR